MSLLTLTAIQAQEPQAIASPYIEVIKLKWEKQTRLPQNFDPSAGSTGTINDPTRSSRGGSGGGSGSAGADGTTQGMQPSAPSRVSYVYAYSMKVKNVGSKVIEAVAWDYVFLDPTTSAEIGRHQFLSFETVQPDKTSTFQGSQRVPPVRSVRTQTAADNNHPKLSEKYDIKCVLYADGTTWRDANSAQDICDLLKKGKAGLSRKRSPGL